MLFESKLSFIEPTGVGISSWINRGDDRANRCFLVFLGHVLGIFLNFLLVRIEN